MSRHDILNYARWLKAPALACVAIIFCLSSATASTSKANEIEWGGVGPDGNPTVNLYFFWSRNCDHCRKALPFVETLSQQYPWLILQSREVSHDRSNAELYVSLARSIGQEARSVPAFIFCATMLTGYEAADTTGANLRKQLLKCHESMLGAVAMPAGSTPYPQIQLPLLGDLNVQAMSLPVLTGILALLDSFNPCAFFILLFLLSLLVHARSRSRMLVIGSTFVLFSGLVYFLFMAAWLNVFLLAGELTWVTSVAALFAIVFAIINIKDYFLFGRGITLGISDAAKPRLFARIRGLVGGNSLPAMVMATIILAIAANSYELLCTAGFPMVYTRILTLNELSAYRYYLYLVFYNAVYILPLVGIVVVCAVTLGSRKLSEREGGILKLISGLMMLGLGGILLAAPAALNHLGSAMLVLGGAIIAAFLVIKMWPLDGKVRNRSG